MRARGGTPLWLAPWGRLSEGSTNAGSIEIGSVNGRPRLLTPGFVQSACVHGVKADVVYQFYYYFLGFRIVARDRQGDSARAARRFAPLRQVFSIDIVAQVSGLI